MNINATKMNKKPCNLLSPGFFLFLVALEFSSENGLTVALVAILSGLLNDTTKNMPIVKAMNITQLVVIGFIL